MKRLIITIVLVIVFSNTAFGQEVTPEVTEEPVEIKSIEFEVSEGISPPINIDLPDNWISYDILQPIADIDGELRVLTYTAYIGPVTDGRGVIILMWGFESLGLSPTYTSLYVDGLRLFHMAIVEPGCLVGTDVEREFIVGDLPAQGTYFSITKCPGTLDTKGWFAGLEQDDVNFVFYLYAEPIEAMDGPAADELRAILDTVEFRVPEWIEEQRLLAEVTPEATAEIGD